MDEDTQRELLIRVFDNVLWEQRVNPQPGELDAIERESGRWMVCGDLLTEAICLSRVILTWYSDPVEAVSILSSELFSRLFGWAVQEEEKIRSATGEDTRFVAEMQKYLSGFHAVRQPEIITARINEVSSARGRAVRRARGLPDLSAHVVGYVWAAHHVLPSISHAEMLDDLQRYSGNDQVASEYAQETPRREVVLNIIHRLQDSHPGPAPVPGRQKMLWD